MVEFEINGVSLIKKVGGQFDSFKTHLFVLVDDATGVNYIAGENKNGIFLLTPRLNSDGSLYISHVKV